MSKIKTAKNTKQGVAAKEADQMSDIHVAVRVITEELAKIANEIEEIPGCSCGQMDSQTMMRMQKIDFCSQRLMDLSTLIRQFSDGEAMGSEGLLAKLSQTARLEHTQNLFKKAS